MEGQTKAGFGGPLEAEEIQFEQPTQEGSAAPKSSPVQGKSSGIWSRAQGHGGFPGGAFPSPWSDADPIYFTPNSSAKAVI